LKIPQFVVSLFFLFLSFSYGQPINKNQPPKDGGATIKQTTQKNKTTFQTIETNQNTKQSENQAEEKIATYTLCLVWVTGFLGAVTFALFIATFFLAKSAIEQEKDFRNHTKLEMRAYISVNMRSEDMEVAKGRPTGRHQREFTFSPNIINTGKTPAHKIRIEGIVAPQIIDFHPVPIIDSPNRNSTISLHPQASIYIKPNGQNQFTADDQQPILSTENKALFIYGTIFYLDIFEMEWRTNYCFSCTWKNEGLKTIFELVRSNHHNDAT
jgi:MFS superfamily sulfate permease-like transporter